ncbi:MAG: HD domain-containing protein [Tissierellia bacterium]|nr:HD domain-containing protein [Tissierellia bacterium]
MKINIPNDVSLILNEIENNGYEAYIVGGCVRDSLLDKAPNDWDICTNAKPNEILNVFKDYKTIPTGLNHGTITVVINGEHYEITTFRIDGDYSDGRRPDRVEYTDDIVKDLSRRDFTINAMAYNEKDGLIDPFYGLNYLEHKEIRCVGMANERFKEDGLRMIRAIRFASQLDFRISTGTSSAIIKNKELITNISQERIREELNKILLSNNPSKGIKLLGGLELIDYIIPELSPCVNFNQYNLNHDKDVFEHTMAVLDNIEPKLELRLAALFHDIGKPDTFTLDESGIGHFYKHHKESARICRDVMTRLKYSNKEIEYVSELVYYHMIRYEKINSTIAKRFINKVGKDKIEDLFKLFIADRIGMNIPCVLNDIYKLKFECERVLSEKQPLGVKDLDINGYDLMEIGIPQGKAIGIILNSLLECVLENPELNNKNILLEIAKNTHL